MHNSILELNDLFSVTELISLNTEFSENREVDITGSFAFADDVSAMTLEVTTSDKDGDSVSIVWSHRLADAVVTSRDSNSFIH